MNYKETDIDKLKDLDVGQVAALYAARRSMLKKFSTGAALVKDGKVVEIGWSHVGHVSWNATPYSTHAEVHAIRRAGPLAKGCDIYIATISRKGNITSAQPCVSCADYLTKFKDIGTILYTLQGGNWGQVDSQILPSLYGLACDS